jgi:apolipoprotein N-acyltransferase
MDRAATLTRAIQIVVLLFGAFGSFLTAIAPPEVSLIATGTASMSALVVFLLATVLAQARKTASLRKKWAIAAAACACIGAASAIVYRSNLERLTIGWPPETLEQRYVRGTRLTPDAARYIEAHPQKSIADVLADHGGPSQRELVWSESSIRAAKTTLTINYLTMVIAFSLAVASLLEVVALRKRRAE